MSKSYKIFLIILYCLLHVGCQNNDNSGMPSPTPSSIEDTVYKIAVSEIYPSGQVFLVMDKTTAITMDEAQIARLPGLDNETLASFEAKNEDSFPVNDNLELHGEVILTNRRKLRNEFRKGDPHYYLELDFDALHAAYPEVAGILELSRVGTNSEFDQALVQIALYDMSGTCYENIVVFLTANNGSWEIKNSDKIEICS